MGISKSMKICRRTRSTNGRSFTERDAQRRACRCTQIAALWATGATEVGVAAIAEAGTPPPVPNVSCFRRFLFLSNMGSKWFFFFFFFLFLMFFFFYIYMLFIYINFAKTFIRKIKSKPKIEIEIQ